MNHQTTRKRLERLERGMIRPVWLDGLVSWVKAGREGDERALNFPLEGRSIQEIGAAWHETDQ